jgi:hypothetical protein
MMKIIRQVRYTMHIIYLRKSACFKFKGFIFPFSKIDYLDDTIRYIHISYTIWHPIYGILFARGTSM